MEPLASPPFLTGGLVLRHFSSLQSARLLHRSCDPPVHRLFNLMKLNWLEQPNQRFHRVSGSAGAAGMRVCIFIT
jgi:hypothetical protein